MSKPEAPARDEFFESLLGDFLDESGQLLDRLNENLLQLDEWVRSLDEGERRRCDEGLLNEMFRSAHSLKGLSAMLGLTDINQLTHKVENVFDAARKDELAVGSEVVELMFQAVDRLVGLVDALKDPDAEPVECASVVEGIGRVLQAAGAERKQTTQADAEKAIAQETAAAAAPPPAQETELGGRPEAGRTNECPEAERNDGRPEAERSEAQGVSAPGAALSSTASPAPASQSPEARIEPQPAEQPPDVFRDIRDESELPAKYVSIFIDETELSLDSLTETLLASEGAEGRATIEKLLIIAHRIKGSAASVGLNRAAKLAHLMEDLLQGLLGKGSPLTAEMTDAMLKCTDGLRQYVQGLRHGRPESAHFGQLARELLAAQEARGPSVPASSPATARAPSGPVPAAAPPGGAPGIAPELRRRVAAALPEDAAAVVGEVTFEPNLPLAGLKARLVYEKLCNLGEVCHFDPPPDGLDELEDLPAVAFGLVTDRPVSAIYGHLRIAGVQRALIEPLATRSQSARPADKDAQATATAAATPAAGAPARSPTAPDAAAPKAARTAAAAPKAADAAGESSKEPAGDGGSRPTETLRVDIERLDQLMNLAGQLVISKARFARISDSLKSVLSNRHTAQILDNACATLGKIGGSDLRCDPAHLQIELETVRAHARRIQNDLEEVRREVRALADVRLAANNLQEAIHQLDRVTDGIQQSVMDTRMVPIGPLFARFKRVVRDITRVNGKSVRLVIQGEKTELDKRMIDELGDPLIHMVRNSVDHGIEAPEVRESLGKPRQGTVTLDAFHRGNSIVIRVADDGKGLDAAKILRKAIEKGLVSEADGEKMTPQQIYQLIWEPGLSTADKVTEVSGRGMGMDIVMSKISDLNGTVDVESAPGAGTTMTIKLPLTLAILPSLMTEIDGDVFALPVESVVEIVSVGRQQMHTIHGTWTARVRGSVISVVKLSEVFTWSQSGASAPPRDGGENTLVIVGDTGRQLGLVVDRVLGEEDIVIKSMAENYRNVPGIAGASILGDGRVSLILDVAALLEMASSRPATVSCEE